MGKMIFNEGEITNSVYTIYEGCLDVMKKDYKGGDRRIYYVEPGELIGYRSAICGDSHTSTVTVHRNSLVCVIDKKVFLETFLRNKDFTMNLMKYLSEQICLREKKIEELESMY
jgi:CRP/FNR family transcriptional regulator